MTNDSALPKMTVGYEKLPGDGVGFIHHEWKDRLAQAGLRTFEDFLKITGVALSKPGLGTRYRALLDLGEGAGRVFYKRYDGEAWSSLWRRAWEDRSREAIALREVRVALALRDAGIETFIPIAWGWRGNWGATQQSFILMSQVPGVSLEKWLPGRFAADAGGWAARKKLVADLAMFVRRLHGQGWFHRDLYLCHVFIDGSETAPSLALVDLARMFRPGKMERWRIKDLAQLHFSTPFVEASSAMRLRFAKEYFGVLKLGDSHKSLIREVIQRSRRMRDRESRKNVSSPI